MKFKVYDFLFFLAVFTIALWEPALRLLELLKKHRKPKRIIDQLPEMPVTQEKKVEKTVSKAGIKQENNKSIRRENYEWRDVTRDWWREQP